MKSFFITHVINQNWIQRLKSHETKFDKNNQNLIDFYGGLIRGHGIVNYKYCMEPSQPCLIPAAWKYKYSGRSWKNLDFTRVETDLVWQTGNIQLKYPCDTVVKCDPRNLNNFPKYFKIERLCFISLTRYFVRNSKIIWQFLLIIV